MQIMIVNDFHAIRQGLNHERVNSCKSPENVEVIRMSNVFILSKKKSTVDQCGPASRAQKEEE